jgi:multidrug efflux pump subunit AcrA (membrane-fusion protein)
MRRALLALLLAGCQGVAAAPTESPDASVEASADLFDGRVVPTNATDLQAPANQFRVAGWSSDSSWTKIVDLVPEGQKVKAGDVVARFEFRATEALPRIKEQIQKAQADAQQFAIEQEAWVRNLQTDRDKLALAAERAKLDTQKEGAVSQRQLALYRIDADIAQFDADAAVERLAVAHRHGAAQAEWHKENVARAQAQQERFDAYKRRFELRAPHDGVVRYAFLPHEHRKVQKGDGMAAGRQVVSIARDEKLSVRFYVPEHRLHEVAVGQKVRVKSLTTSDERLATVRHVDTFPQEIGFLLEDDQRPDAREKAFVVIADFDGETGELAAGNEIRVGL